MNNSQTPVYHLAECLVLVAKDQHGKRATGSSHLETIITEAPAFTNSPLTYSVPPKSIHKIPGHSHNYKQMK